MLRGSSLLFFGTIRAMQMIGLSGLVEANLPFNLFIFLQAMIEFAQMDILGSEILYEEIFNFKETTPISQKFEFNGIGDKNFVNNSGSYLSMLIVLFFSTIVLFVLNKLATCLIQYSCARKIGVWAYKKCYYDSLEQQCCKLILESYFDVSICTFINLLAFMESRNLEEFYLFFTTIDDAFCSTIVLIHIVLVIFLPMFCHYIQKE